MKKNNFILKPSSRPHIESILNNIFSEKGITQMILRFEDYPGDLFRTFINHAESQSEFSLSVFACHQCQHRRVEGKIIHGERNKFLTLCDRRSHLEIWHGRKLSVALHPFEEHHQLKSPQYTDDSTLFLIAQSIQRIREESYKNTLLSSWCS